MLLLPLLKTSTLSPAVFYSRNDFAFDWFLKLAATYYVITIESYFQIRKIKFLQFSITYYIAAYHIL